MGVKCKTTVKKGVYDASFDENFIFQVPDVAAGVSAS